MHMAKNLTILSHPQRVRILYKTILRLHRGLPDELKQLGDNYAKDEFKRHKKCNQREAEMFMIEWTKYVVTLTEQLGLIGKPKGKLGLPLDNELIEKLRNDQVIQLYELMKVTKGEISEK